MHWTLLTKHSNVFWCGMLSTSHVQITQNRRRCNSWSSFSWLSTDPTETQRCAGRGDQFRQGTWSRIPEVRPGDQQEELYIPVPTPPIFSPPPPLHRSINPPLVGLDMTNSLSRHTSLPPEDWDHPELTTTVSTTTTNTAVSASTRVAFPSQDGTAGDNDVSSGPDALQSHRGGLSGKRTLSELLKLHAEKGTNVHFTTEEATRLEETLGRWVRCSFCSPSLWRCVGWPAGG
jgi:hypothetical protein